VFVAVGQPLPDGAARAAIDDVEQPRAVQVDQAGHEPRPPRRAGVQKARLVDTQRADAAGAGHIVDQRLSMVDDARMIVCQPTPRSRADRGDAVAIAADSAARGRSRTLGSTIRAPTAGCCSVHEPDTAMAKLRSDCHVHRRSRRCLLHARFVDWQPPTAA
jgi:hypothetical protein